MKESRFFDENFNRLPTPPHLAGLIVVGTTFGSSLETHKLLVTRPEYNTGKYKLLSLNRSPSEGNHLGDYKSQYTLEGFNNDKDIILFVFPQSRWVDAMLFLAQVESNPKWQEMNRARVFPPKK